MNNTKHAKELSQYFTSAADAEWCCGVIKTFLTKHKLKYKDYVWLESAAGAGSFVDAAKKTFKNVKVEAYDIEPQREDIIYRDFLNSEFEDKNYLSFGNPPFGTKGKLAVDFVNKSLELGSLVCFIVPIQFEKYSIQLQINPEARLVLSKTIPNNIYNRAGVDVKINCVFQIWTTLSEEIIPDKDIRIRERPATKHSDFEMFLYNNVPDALKYFDKETYGWNFAVPRQGYYDYSLRITNPEELNPRIQYMFFKAKNKTVLNRLNRFDFAKLAAKNTTTPGYGKADVVKEYMMLYE